MTHQQIAEAISKHQFATVYEHFSDDIVWQMINGENIKGKVAVTKTCEESVAYLAKVTTTFKKFKSYIAENAVIIESAADYDDSGEISSVASCDIYEFEQDQLRKITSYNIEVT